MKRLTLIASMLLVTAVTVNGFTVHFLDPRVLMQSLTASVKADRGRELTFADLKIKPLPRPALVVSSLRLGITAGAAQP